MRRLWIAALLAIVTFAVTVASAAGYTVTVHNGSIRVPSSGVGAVSTVVNTICPNVKVIETAPLLDPFYVIYVGIDVFDPTCNARVRVTLQNASGSLAITYLSDPLANGQATAYPVTGPGWHTSQGRVASIRVELIAP
ncbi:MAG TPA: hypothetical protein VK139_02265 [Microbacteriaceae bacterium]|nr:hypothetical protein [Microbacteriaceae bacterium]